MTENQTDNSKEKNVIKCTIKNPEIFTYSLNENELTHSYRDEFGLTVWERIKLKFRRKNKERN
jgi:hypothetical protein